MKQFGEIELPSEDLPNGEVEDTNHNDNATSVWNKSMLDYAEDQFQCCICTEMIINAVTLNCSHTFCSYCILQWKERKSYCPICRVKIKVQLHTKIIDSFIDKLVSNSNSEVQSHRKVLKEEREENEKKLKQSSDFGCDSCDTSNFDIDDDDDYEDDDSSQSLFGLYYHSPFDGGVIFDSDLDDIYDVGFLSYEQDYDEQSEVLEQPVAPPPQEANTGPTLVNGAYYGGYGRCFNCGETGHWRNGCPSRRNYHTYGNCFSCGEYGHWASTCPNR